MGIPSGDLISGKTFAISEMKGVAVVASGATGTIITQAPPAGRVIGLWVLKSTANFTSRTTVLFDGVAKVSSVLMRADLASVNILDAYILSGGGTLLLANDKDDILTVTTDVATTANLVWGYVIGDYV
jgi:hypothetical protein